MQSSTTRPVFAQGYTVRTYTVKDSCCLAHVNSANQNLTGCVVTGTYQPVSKGPYKDPVPKDILSNIVKRNIQYKDALNLSPTVPLGAIVCCNW
jgi:hypothetical protein